jgi:hypothetical protein
MGTFVEKTGPSPGGVRALDQSESVACELYCHPGETIYLIPDVREPGMWAACSLTVAYYRGAPGPQVMRRPVRRFIGRLG